MTPKTTKDSQTNDNDADSRREGRLRSEEGGNHHHHHNSPLEEHKPLDIYSHISVTENPFGDSVFDVYEKVDDIEEGGTGDIFKVRKKDNEHHNNNDGRYYAMKCIDKDFLFGTFMKELRNEIEVLRSIDHPNVVRILETYETKQYMYLIMEYCSGGTLWSRCSHHPGKCTESDVASIMTQVLSAVALCHKHKVVHRDIKLENILFETAAENSQVKLIDFGTSQKYKPPRGDYTMKLQVGTTYTNAPEVLQGEYTEAADVWSCGVVAYVLLSGGSPPFDAKEKKDIPDEIKKGIYTMNGSDWEGISKEAKAFVASLLKLDPEQRPSAEDCLHLPWLTSHTQSERMPPPPQVMELVQRALQQSEEEPQLKRLAKMIMAHDAPLTKLETLRQAFDSIDQSRDGTITHSEFLQALQASSISAEHLEELFAELDQNETGVINYTEFLSATLEAQGRIEDEMLEDAFDKLDVGNSGAISKEDLSELMDSKNLPTSSDEVAEAILAQVDTEEEGKVSHDEFVEMFREDES